jgi:hypothetical protein
MIAKGGKCPVCKKELAPLNQWSKIIWVKDEGWQHQDCYLK